MEREQPTWDTTDTPPSTSHVGPTSHAISGKLSSKDPFPLVGISNDRRSAMAWKTHYHLFTKI